MSDKICKIDKLIQQVKYQEALKECDNLLKDNKDKASLKMIKYLKGKIFSYIGDYKKSNIMLNEVINEYGENEILYYMIGQNYYELYMYDEAIENYMNSYNLKQNDLYTINNIGLCYLHKGNYDEAIRWYKKALKIDKNDIDVINNLGMVYYYKKEFKKGLEYFKRANKIDPKDEDIKNKIKITEGLMNDNSINEIR